MHLARDYERVLEVAGYCFKFRQSRLYLFERQESNKQTKNYP